MAEKVSHCIGDKVGFLIFFDLACVDIRQFYFSYSFPMVITSIQIVYNYFIDIAAFS